ncbi:hypothetical protein FDENT_5034 [Fusarium denticulatum]|uniref:Uncharacterized protein n=1 Tax=Fusarium denticulatum TaxID=48507 RepID=A0A8H5UEI7_9HYPO|nr:hypothetical protein FDENT_5034 [Fusarium denticulatum]
MFAAGVKGLGFALQTTPGENHFLTLSGHCSTILHNRSDVCEPKARSIGTLLQGFAGSWISLTSESYLNGRKLIPKSFRGVWNRYYRQMSKHNQELWEMFTEGKSATTKGAYELADIAKKIREPNQISQTPTLRLGDEVAESDREDRDGQEGKVPRQ